MSGVHSAAADGEIGVDEEREERMRHQPHRPCQICIAVRCEICIAIQMPNVHCSQMSNLHCSQMSNVRCSQMCNHMSDVRISAGNSDAHAADLR